MRRVSCFILGVAGFVLRFNLYGQSNENCFLQDFEPRRASLPVAVDSAKPAGPATVTVTVIFITSFRAAVIFFGYFGAGIII